MLKKGNIIKNCDNGKWMVVVDIEKDGCTITAKYLNWLQFCFFWIKKQIINKLKNLFKDTGGHNNDPRIH